MDDAQVWDDPGYRRYVEAGGVIRISAARCAAPSHADHAAILAHALSHQAPPGLGGMPPSACAPVRAAELIGIRPEPIDAAAFHGPGYDPLSRRPMPGAQGGFGAPGSGGRGFGACFFHAVQGLRLMAEEALRLYGAIAWALCPAAPGLPDPTLLRWPSEPLCGPAPILRYGMEWWGVFAVSCHAPGTGALFAIVAADTD